MNLADGQWHRLHPATPLLRGGIALLAIIGVIVANLRERLLEFFFPVPVYGDDPIDEIVSRGLVGWALLAIAVGLAIGVGFFFLSWRLHSFRITDEAVEVRSGILNRTHRRARLDRIQGVSITRPLIARIFGAAKIDITVAGHDANVQLAYLSSSLTDALRRDILVLASGARRAVDAAPDADAAPHSGTGPTAAPPPGLTGLVSQRVTEFIAPELDPSLAPPESVVRIPPGRLAASIVLSPFTLFLVALIAAMAYGFTQGAVWPVFAVLPGIIGGASYYLNRVTRMLRYSIAGTADGVRMGYGLLSTNNETLPPGRIHAIGVHQPLFWRPFGWWRVQVDTAGHSSSDRQQRDNTTVLPVGSLADVRAVLGLILPAFTGPEAEGVIEAGLVSRGGADGYTSAPRRAAWLRPFSWRRTGYGRVSGALLLRRGILSRELAAVPLARLQSVSVRQGPVHRMLRLASVQFQTVAGPVRPALDVADVGTAGALFEQAAADAVAYARIDRSHEWGRA